MQTNIHTTLEKSAIAWSYLDTIILAYKVLLDAQTEYGSIYKDKMHEQIKSKYRRNFAAKLQAFYNSNMALFSSYLETDEFKQLHPDSKITKNHYYNLFKDEIDGEMLFEMTEIICQWAQTRGPFKTMNKFSDPNMALMGQYNG